MVDGWWAIDDVWRMSIGDDDVYVVVDVNVGGDDVDDGDYGDDDGNG